MKTVFLFLALFVSFFSFSQTYWGRVTTGQYTNEAMDVVTDNSGNSYVTGYITGETAFATTTVFPTAQGNGAIYVAKYSVNGSLLWLKKYDGSFADRGRSIALDPSGNVLVTGPMVVLSILEVSQSVLPPIQEMYFC